MKLNQVVDLKLTNYKAGNIRNGEYFRVLSRDLKVVIEINKYIFYSCEVQGIKHSKLKENPCMGRFGPPPPSAATPHSPTLDYSILT